MTEVEECGNVCGHNTGDQNWGKHNFGDHNLGNHNVGHQNDGHKNIGDQNNGDQNYGDQNFGDQNFGNNNIGDQNHGDQNFGRNNYGDQNYGDHNFGDQNFGNHNVGHYNSTDRALGWFNTKATLEYSIFNKPYDGRLTFSDMPRFLHDVELTSWIRAQDMTEREKEHNPSYTSCDGYLRLNDYKEAIQKAWDKAPEEERRQVLDLPNWDNEIFKEITGIDVENELQNQSNQED